MAYTLYLYKEFPSKSGKTIRLEIFERDYVGSAIEIEALSPTPATLTTDNTNNSVFMPIIKTYLGVNIKDTEQIDYTRLFTPDATKFKVIIKVAGTTEWAGYLTPDSFSQSLQYRSEINLIARDNLGMLSEFTYSSGNTFGTIRNLIDLSLTTIGFQANWEYRVKKLDANGTNVLDGYIPLRAYTGKNYQEVLETLLTGIGCQLRYVGGNKYAIFDIADLKGYGDTTTSQDFKFIEQSGMMELVPAWKDITINQDYLLAEEIISNRLAADDYIFRANRLFNTKIGKQDDPIPQVLIPCYDLLGAGWGGTMAIPSPYDFVGEKPSNILLPIVELPVITAPYIEISNVVPPYNGGLEIQFNVHNAFLAPDEELFSEGILSLTDQLPTNAVNYGGAGIWLYYNVFLESGGKIYDLGNTWQEIASKSAAVARFFKIDKPVTEEGEDDVVITGSIDVACNITIMSLLEGGTISLRLYGYNFYGTFYRRDFFDCVVRISDLKFVLKNDEPGGRTTTATIDANYNLRGDVSLALGEVPASKMNYFSMLGGIYQNLAPYYPPMTGFQRTEEIVYHLSELVGREIAHHYKTQRKKLSGNIINSDTFAAMPSFAKPFYDGSKYYALNYGSLDFRSEVMSVELIEVEDYETEDYTFVEATIDTGGSSLGSGETEFIQWSAAGNAKRIYELDTASEADTAGSFAVIDKLGMSAAKKVPLFTLLDQKENLLPETPTDPEQKFLNGNREWSLINLGSNGNSPRVFFTSIASDVATYKELSYAPEATTSYCETSITNAEVLCSTFLYPLGVGVESLDAGTWEFEFFAKVSGTAGNVTMRAEVFKRSTAGVETTLFSKSSEIINNTTYKFIPIQYTSVAIPVAATDRIGVRVYGKNTIAAAITLSWAVGDGDASYFVTPLNMRHAQLRGKNDEAGFQHITEAAQTFSGNKTFSNDVSALELISTRLRIPTGTPSGLTLDKWYLYADATGFGGEVPSGGAITDLYSLTDVALTGITSSLPAGQMLLTNGTKWANIAATTTNITEGTNLYYTNARVKTYADTLYLAQSLKGSANGLAELDENGFVKNTQLPSYVDDVLEYDNLAAFPATGETGKIYIAKDTNKTYRWSGTGYAVISETLALGETSSTAYRGDRGKTAYDHTFLTNNPHSVTAAQVGALALTGGTMSNTNLVTNLNADLLDGLQSTSFSQRVQYSITNSSTGWKRIAYRGGSDGRGSVTIILQTIGGDFPPSKVEINVEPLWGFSGTGYFSNIINSGFPISELRITTEGTNTYIEGYFTSSFSEGYSTQIDSGISNYVIIGGELQAGGGTVGDSMTIINGYNTYGGANVLGNITMSENINTRLRIPEGTPSGLTENKWYLYADATGFSGEVPSGSVITDMYSLTDTEFSAVMPSAGKMIRSNGTKWVDVTPTTAMITEETNLYYTNARVKAYGDTLYAPLSHTHGNISNDGKIGTTASLPILTGTGGTLVAKAAGLSTQYLNGVGEWGTPPDTIYTLTKEAVEGVLTGDISSHTHDGRYFTETESDNRFLGITAKAADSDKLDGQDSTYFATAAQLNAANLTNGYLPYWNGSSLVNSLLSQSGDVLYLAGNTNKTIQIRSISSWHYNIKTLSDDFIISDADNYEFLRCYYNGGTKYTKIGAIASFSTNVGIGTVTPVSLGAGITTVDIRSTSTTGGAGFRFGMSDASKGALYLYNNDIRLSVTNGNAIIDNANLWIGYESGRTEKLAVNGTTYFNGNSQVVGNLTMAENINTRLRIPILSGTPSGLTENQYYLFIQQ